MNRNRYSEPSGPALPNRPSPSNGGSSGGPTPSPIIPVPHPPGPSPIIPVPHPPEPSPIIPVPKPPAQCLNLCSSQQLGCCNQENSSKACAGPAHLTNQFDIGSRSCCTGKKYTAAGGLINFCSTNNGAERPNSMLVNQDMKNSYPNSMNIRLRENFSGQNCTPSQAAKNLQRFKNSTTPPNFSGIY